jgi:hypothetical protein
VRPQPAKELKMPIAKISSSLTVTDWSKKVGSLDKNGAVANQLKTLNKQYDEVPFQLLETDGLDSVQQVKERIGQIEGQFSKAAKAASEQAKAIAVQAKKSEAEFRKDAQAPKTAAPAAAAVAQAAADLVKELGAAADSALAALKSMLGKLEAQEKKDQLAAKKDEKESDEEDAEDLAAHKDEKKFRDKVKATILSALKKVKGEGAPPAKFTIAVLGKTWGVYLAKTAGESEKKIAMRLAGLTSGFKHCKGTVHWDPKAKVWVFEGVNVPLGRANATAMALCLKPLIGFAPRVRLQKPGEIGEDSEGGDPDPDEREQLAQETKAGPGGPAGVDPVKAFTARLSAIMPKVKASVAAGGSSADQVKSAVAKAGELAGRGDATKAHALLDQVEKMLAARSPAEPAAAAAAGAAGSLSLVKLGTARLAWATVREQALRGIEELVKRIEQEYRDEADQRAQVQAATARLRSLAGNLKSDLETQLDAVLNEHDAARRAALMRTAKSALTNVLTVVAQDPLMKELDGNELMPEMQIVKPMQERLREIAAALG